jgi:hypothetical protein
MILLIVVNNKKCNIKHRNIRKSRKHKTPAYDRKNLETVSCITSHARRDRKRNFLVLIHKIHHQLILAQAHTAHLIDMKTRITIAHIEKQKKKQIE